jgi:hypothetical protein
VQDLNLGFNSGKQWATILSRLLARFVGLSSITPTSLSPHYSLVRALTFDCKRDNAGPTFDCETNNDGHTYGTSKQPCGGSLLLWDYQSLIGL